MAAIAPLNYDERRDSSPLNFFGVQNHVGSHPAIWRRWMGTDLVLASLGTGIACFLALHTYSARVYSPRYALWQIVYIVLTLLSLKTVGFYEQGSGLSIQEDLTCIFQATVLASLIFLTIQLTADFRGLPIWFVCSAAIINAGFLVNARHVQRSITRRKVARGEAARHVLVVGGGALGRSLAHTIESNRDLGMVVKGFLDDRCTEESGILGSISDFVDVARAQFVDEILITVPVSRTGILQLMQEARERHICVRVIPPLRQPFPSTIAMDFVGSYPAFTLHSEPAPAISLLLKRIMDILGSCILLILLGPLMLLIALAIKLNSPGPVFYCADRIGKKGRRFCFYKFRTMVQGADALKPTLLSMNEREPEGPLFKIAADPRVTGIGRVLRATSMDELPQLWNVLKGEMSLVGPRPHPVDDFRKYRLEHLRRLNVMPGLTGLWQVTARSDPSFARNMQLDLAYIERWSLWMDVTILAKTVAAVFRADGR